MPQDSISISIARTVAKELTSEFGSELFKESDLDFILESQETKSIFESESASRFTVGATIAALLIQACTLGLQCYQTLYKQQNQSPSIQLIIEQIQEDPNFRIIDSLSAKQQKLIVELAAKEVIKQCNDAQEQPQDVNETSK